jgi:small-conductance mechanosensitive channel
MLPVIIVGFVMITLGVALLLLGEVPFVAGRRISAIRSRLIGAFLVIFLPVSLIVQLVCKLIFGDDAIDGLVVTWIVFTICWIAISVVMFRVLVPKRGAKASAKTKPKVETPRKKQAKAAPAKADEEELPWLVEEPAPEPMPEPRPAGKKAHKKSAGADPFDFS